MDGSMKPINYDFLRKLVNTEGLSNVLQKHSTPEAHKAVMSSYHQVFIDPHPQANLPPIHTEKRLAEKSLSQQTTGARDAQQNGDHMLRSCDERPTESQKQVLAIEYPQHDIRQYTRSVHANNKAAQPKITKGSRLQALRQLLKRPQYERSSEDNEQIYKQMRQFDMLRAQIGDNQLMQQVASVAKLERWPEGDVTLLAHGSLFLLLRGSITALSEPQIRDFDENYEDFIAKCRTLDSDQQIVLRAGDVFGTLVYTEQPSDGNEKLLAFHLPEDGTEFLKVSAYDYERIKQQTESKDEVQKSNLLRENPNYALWSTQPLQRVARLIEWLTVPANTVIVSEGFRAPFIAYVRSGSCILLRKLVVNKTLKNGKTVQRTEQIVMSRVGQRQSFGEASILDGEDMPCSLVAEEDVVLAVLRPDRLQELDSDTIALIGQSADEKLGRMPIEEVEREYVIQESAKEWNETKQAVVDDVINSRGIRPGMGKWAK